ncbi:MAG: SAM-dependent methyltransferase, partial [Nostoc sp.]
NGSVADFAVAAENLSRLVSDVAEVQDGLSILDVGCGFGGTIATLNERFCNMHLIGININKEQLSRAEISVKAIADNHIEFIYADDCQLPFPDGYFDVVFAIESIFAF